MTNYTTGHDAEKQAAEYLSSQGFKIKELNWKTKYCEIDIVAEKDGCVYFVEVKRRTTDKQGEGFDYITPQKLKRMKFAAEIWLQDHNWDDECTLAAVSMTADDLQFIEMLDQ